MLFSSFISAYSLQSIPCIGRSTVVPIVLALLTAVSSIQIQCETPAATGSIASSISQTMPKSTTMAIFHDRPMPAGLMPDLIAALQQSLRAGDADLAELPGQSAATGLAGSQPPSVQILSGDQITPGMVVENSVTVYLHGSCAPVAHAPVFDHDPITGALGWVPETHGHIDRFVHVDCSRLTTLLAEVNYGQPREQQRRVMAAAISRVILHEWIHIATQDPHHAHEGIGKSAFSVRDLVAGFNHGHQPQTSIRIVGSPIGNSPYEGRLNAPLPAQPQRSAFR